MLVHLDPERATAAIVASVSAERPKPEIRVSPSQSAPIRTARWRSTCRRDGEMPDEPRHRLDEEAEVPAVMRRAREDEPEAILTGNGV